MSVLFTFPGQGAQRPGMLHDLPDHPETVRILGEVGVVLGADPLTLDTADALASSYAVQLCLLIAGVATARVLIAHGAGPHLVAGLSIGAYPAAVIAGCLDFADALRLVAKRGRLMDQAYPSGYGMAAIVGLDRAQIESLLVRVHSLESPVYLANLNAERQIVVAGAAEALTAAMRLAFDHGANKAELLAVSVPSHCPLLDAAAREMAVALYAVTIRPPSLIYLSSNTARAISEPERIADDLAGNMARQVFWHDTARQAWERGARLAVEMPSGAVLTGLTEHIFADGLAVCCENNSVENLVSLISRERAASVT
jgi:malonate decarboxylase epsilon subunit